MYNPWCFAGGTIRHLQKAFPEMEIIEDKIGLLGKLTSSKIQNVFEHKIEFAGTPREEKIKILTEQYQVSSKAVSKRIEELELLPDRLQQSIIY